MKGYYFITDTKLSRRGNINDVLAAERCGVEYVQYRCKDAETLQMYKEAQKLREICKSAIFLINDRVDIALSVDADGVHLGQTDMPANIARRILGPNKTIGITVHNLEQALAAKEAGADYLGVSPIFQTTTKPDAGKPAGLSLIEDVKKSVEIPLVAIGGINLENAPLVISAGADALCAISAVVTLENVDDEILKFQRLFNPLNDAQLH